MLTTSLKKIFDYGSSMHQTEHYKLLMTHFGKTYMTIDDSPLSYLDLLELTDMEYVLDCTFTSPEFDKTWREFSLWCCEEIASYITLDSCKEAIAIARKYQMDLASIEELKQSHDVAYSEYLHDEHKLYGLAHYANSTAAHAANPITNQSIIECYNSYALAMDKLGQSFTLSEKKQKDKFIELVS